MNDGPVGRTKHGTLSLDDLASLAPGLGRLMREISERYSTMYFAAQGGNWDLAHYCYRGMKKMFATGSVTRPKMKGALASYVETHLAPLDDAIRAGDWARFAAAFSAATEEANRVHHALGYGYIEWRLPSEPPAHLTLSPVPPRATSKKTADS
jgi:hypothetical protein